MTWASLVGRRAGLGLVWGSLAVSCFGLVSSPARAHSVLEVGIEAGRVVASCVDAVECGADEPCGSGICELVDDTLSVCVEPDVGVRFEIFCCETTDDCPTRDGRPPQSCTQVIGDVSLCTWSASAPRAYNFCSGSSAPSFQSVLACFDTSEGGRLSLADGDCDSDGMLNIDDAQPCVPHMGSTVDAGIMPPIDLGVDEDLGTAEDNGSPTLDHGPASDLGSGVNPGVGFQGGGGCSAGALPSRSGAPLLLVFGALLFARRRRSR